MSAMNYMPISECDNDNSRGSSVTSNVQALNILQSEQKMYMGYLLPTITILREKLVSKEASATITKPLITSLIQDWIKH